MVKWFKITRNQYFGFFTFGVVFFILQQLPYIIMPLVPLETNVLMEMEDKIATLNIIEKILGISCIFVMCLIVRADAKRFSLQTKTEKINFSIAMAAIGAYYIGWVFYFCGYQGLALILTLLVAMPPIYYTFIGMWRKNYLLSIIGAVFLAIHIANVWVNLG